MTTDLPDETAAAAIMLDSDDASDLQDGAFRSAQPAAENAEPAWDDVPRAAQDYPVLESFMQRWLWRLPFLFFAVPTVILTLGLLPYVWGRVLILGMMRPQGPERTYLAVLAAGIAVCMVESAVMARFAWRKRLLWRLGSAVVLVWMLGNAVAIALYVTPSSPRLAVILLYTLASLWVLWLAWLPAWPGPWFLRCGLLAVLLVAAAGFVIVFRIDSLMGDTQLQFALRWASDGRPGDADADEEFVQTADLTATTKYDYPGFLGPERMATAGEMVLSFDWKEKPPRELWRRPMGGGWGSFAVVGDYAVTQEQYGDYECVSCYRLHDGELCWRHRDPARFVSPLKAGDGPRATPTISDGRVYTVGATGILNCLDGATGERIWSVNILVDNGAGNLQHGVAGSPLVYDDFVVVSPTGEEGPSLVAYDRDTGHRIWQAGSDQASYSSPMLAELRGTRQVLLFTSKSIVGHDARTGLVLWSFPWENSEHINAAQPIPNIAVAGQVLISTGYGKGAALLHVDKDDQGNWSAASCWEERVMKTKFTTPVWLFGYVYGLDDGVLECVDVRDGARVWKQGRYGHGQIVIGMGKSQKEAYRELMIVQAENGSVHLLRATQAGLRELGSLDGLASKTWNNPALAGKYLLIRNDREAICYELPVDAE